jgi:hypothetical protein
MAMVPGTAVAMTTPPGVQPSELLAPAGAWTGVGQTWARVGTKPSAGCSATLLPTGRHVVTAGHCVNDPAESDWTVRFDGRVGQKAKIVVARWRYNHDVLYDVAVGELARAAPSWVARYDIYRGRDEVGRVFTKVSYGPVWRGGEPLGSGSDQEPAYKNRKAIGTNRFDTTERWLYAKAARDSLASRVMADNQRRGGVRPEDSLVFDADDGSATRDAAGTHLALVDRGLGDRENNSNGGDSGSPAFIDGKIAGVTTYGYSDLSLFSTAGGPVTDVAVLSYRSLAEARKDLGASYQQVVEFMGTIGVPRRGLLQALNGLLSDNASYGEFSVEQRLSSVAGFIDAELAREPGSTARRTVPPQNPAWTLARLRDRALRDRALRDRALSPNP